jgi:hypothetical protein
MSEKKKNESTVYNIIALRGDPTTATTLSGHKVEKKDRVIIPSPFDGQMITLKCADYHNEHFVYIDPMFEKELPKGEKKRYWFAMCTCGSPAVIISPSQASIHEGHVIGEDLENMLVCQMYMMNLMEYGFGFHMGQEKRMWT